MYKVVAFCGAKGSGKDTAAGAIINEVRIQINFSDPLKNTVKELFGFTDEEIHDPKLKEVIVGRWPYQSPREVLQLFATEGIRTIWPDLWMQNWEKKVNESVNRNIVVTDLRFQNEFDLIRSMSSMIIRIDNPEQDDNKYSGHESEQIYKTFKVDAVIVNDGSIDQLHKKVKELVYGNA